MTPSELKENPKPTLRIVTGILSVLLAAAIFYFSTIPGSGLPPHPAFTNNIAHFCLYLVLGVLLTLTLNSPKRALWLTGLLAVVIASLYGVTDELHQIFTPGRTPDVLDWLTDTAGALVGAVGTIWFLSAQKVKRSRARDESLKR